MVQSHEVSGTGALPELRVLIVAEHASAEFGGEAILPLHYFRLLRERGIEAWLVVHERTRPELDGLFPRDKHRIHYISDSAAHRTLWRLGEPLPRKLAHISVGYAMRTLTPLRARELARELVARHDVTVVHQPMPVSPKEPSFLFDIGAPVVIGPMNGGMTYPPAFQAMQSRVTRSIVGGGRAAAEILNRAIPGKRRASTLIAANPRTREALPETMGRVVELVENGVDLSLWKPPQEPTERVGGPTRFVFLGRLVDWKAVGIVIDALAQVPEGTLEIIGDGPMRPALEAQISSLGLEHRVELAGWVPQHEAAQRIRKADVLVLPSLFECGGAVVLEAMATGLPCIATRWGGPADYLDDSCGVLVDPTSRASMVEQFARSMVRLGADPALRAEMGAAGRQRVVREFDWERKIDRMLEIYAEAIARAGDQPGAIRASRPAETATHHVEQIAIG